MLHKKNDNEVGQSSGPAAGDGKQTAQQADLVKMGNPAEAASVQSTNPGDPSLARANPALGGSSNGHSDQIASDGREAGRKVAGGHSLSEQTDGKGDDALPSR